MGVNVDAIIAARRAELLATVTGRNIACEPRPGGSLTPGELARRRERIPVARHRSTDGRNLRDEL